MRFNNNLLLLASFLGVATALRRGCAPQPDGTGFYTIVADDSVERVAADFCSSTQELQTMNPGVEFRAGNFLRVPCKVRARDCARISNSQNGYYTVVGGDELRLIAEDFCTTPAILDAMNDQITNPDLIGIGWHIEVPCAWNVAP